VAAAARSRRFFNLARTPAASRPYYGENITLRGNVFKAMAREHGFRHHNCSRRDLQSLEIRPPSRIATGVASSDHVISMTSYRACRRSQTMLTATINAEVVVRGAGGVAGISPAGQFYYRNPPFGGRTSRR